MQNEQKTKTTKRLQYIGCDDQQVRYGGNNDPRGVLVEGCIYDVSKEEVHSWHTKISLIGIEGEFNSVCFRDVTK